MAVNLNIPESVIQSFPLQERSSLRELIRLLEVAINADVGAIALDDLSDVNAPSPVNTQVLTYDSGTGDWGADYTFSKLVTDATTSRNAVLSDAGSYVRFTSGSSVTYTIQPQADVEWVDNAQIELEQGGAGAVTIAAGSGVTLRVNSNLTAVTNGQYAVAGLKRVAENEWVLFGNLVAS